MLPPWSSRHGRSDAGVLFAGLLEAPGPSGRTRWVSLELCLKGFQQVWASSLPQPCEQPSWLNAQVDGKGLGAQPRAPRGQRSAKPSEGP